MTEAELRELVNAAQARYDALMPTDRLRHDYMQRRSFVRGMCPEERNYEAWCDRVDETMPHEKFLTDTEIGLILAGSKSPVSTPGEPNG